MTAMYSPDKAEEVAATLNAAEGQEADPRDVWTYTAIHAPDGKGLSCVEVIDGWGVVVGKI